MPSPTVTVIVVESSEEAHPSWAAAAEGGQPVRFAPSEETALGMLASAETTLGCLASPGTIAPIAVTAAVTRATERSGVDATTWLLLSSRGVAADDGAWIDHGTYPTGPFVPPRGPTRAASGGCGGLVVVDVDRLRTLGGAAGHGVDGLVTAGWDQGMGSFVTPWLSHLAAEPSVRASVRRWEEGELARRLAAVRDDPTLTVAIRSDGRRPLLLSRCLTSIRAADAVSPIESVMLIADDPERALAAAGGDAGGLPVAPVPMRPTTAPPRTAALLAGIERATTDYLWFVDDDDHATPEGVRRIKNAVHTGTRPIVVGATAAFEETWEPGAAEPARTVEVRAHNPYEWYRGFSGWNPIPNCGLVMPVAMAKRRLADVVLRHDLGEDFALQLALLSSPGVTVAVAPGRIASVSVRPGEDNTITAPDRSEWQRNLAAFLSDLADDDPASTQALWELGRALRALPERPWDGTPGDEPPPTAFQRLGWKVLPHDVRSAARRLWRR